MRALLPVLLLALCFAAPGRASPVVADLSAYRIRIDSDFSGIRLFMFGARGESGDVVAVIRGPARDFTVRRKERVMGIWTHRKQRKFHGVPDFYAVAGSRPLAEIQDGGLLKRLGIGEEALLASPPGTEDFALALLRHQRERRLYPEETPIGFMGETLFKTVIPFPDTISEGMYTAEIYLLSDGELAGMQSLPIRVEKAGFDAAVHRFAHERPALYGLTAIALALGAGWVAARLFGRR